MVYCLSCGMENLPGSVFCSKCGAKLFMDKKAVETLEKSDRIDYSQLECIIDLSPAEFICNKCGITLCSNCGKNLNYICPHCNVPLVPIKRPINEKT